MSDRKSARIVLSLGDAQFLRSTLRMVPANRLTSLDKRAIEKFDADIKRSEIRAGIRRPHPQPEGER